MQLLESAELQDRFVALWEAVARRFAHRPAVAFELLNEVRDVDPAVWNALAAAPAPVLAADEDGLKTLTIPAPDSKPSRFVRIGVSEDSVDLGTGL